MTIPQAIIVGAVIIGASIIAAKVIAPYEIASGTGIAWRINSITGSVELCNATIELGKPESGNPRCR
jgi:hypothetical protein